ncbi:MAG: methylated-DNA--[protein]-cysteine S-methyltransferase [Desulfatitalea sp.]
MRYDYFDTGHIGVLTLVADDQGLHHIDFESDRTPVRIQGDWQRDTTFFAAAKAQLKAYFQGTLKRFDLPLAPVGTPFQQAVWQTLLTIPYGALVSYRWVAERIDNPKASRAVGGAAGKNPLPIVIPCHRVVGCNGALTGFGGGLAVKQRLIELETKGRYISK